MATPLSVRDPYSGEKIGESAFLTDTQLQSVLDRSVAAFDFWRRSPAHARAEVLRSARDRLASRRGEFEALIRKEAGKPGKLAAIEVDRAIGVLDWAAGEALRFSGELLRLDTTPAGRDGFGIHARFPRGVVLGITPFNFPLNLLIHKVAPAIACGCPIVIKPSPFAPLTALKAVELFQSPDVPGLVQTVIVDDAAAARLTASREFAIISFTGSAAVGSKVRRQAPEKHMALELGGNAWVIVTEDTREETWPRIARRIAGAAFGYAGQSCISVQNVAVAYSIWPRLSELLKDETLATSFGDPSASSVACGPVIHEGAATRVRSLLKLARETLPDGSLIESQQRVGERTPATLVAPVMLLTPEIGTVPDSSPWVSEEIFGPVMTVRPYGSMDDLVDQINSGPYGLQAGVFTSDLGAVQRLFRDLRVGGLIANDVPTTRYDHQPYGGTKASGIGREGVRYAMEDFTESRFLALSPEIP